jgi:hypothetical protein
MICPPCRGAGNLLTAPLFAHPEPHIAAQAIKAQAENLHAQCDGGTWCDCQCEFVSGIMEKLDIV